MQYFTFSDITVPVLGLMIKQINIVYVCTYYGQKPYSYPYGKYIKAFAFPTPPPSPAKRGKNKNIQCHLQI